MRRLASSLHVFIVAAAVGCTPASDAPAADSARPGARAATVVDSALQPEEALRRFRAALPPVAGLSEASDSRDAIVDRFIKAVEQSDTAALKAMVMSRREFAYLYFPDSPHTRPPTVQPPDVVWFLHLESSQRGVSRVLARRGGQRLPARGYACTEPPRRSGQTTIWDDCVLNVTGGRARLFGGIIEHGGRYKIFSYANDL